MLESLHATFSAMSEIDSFVLWISLIKRWAAQSSNLGIVFLFFLGLTLPIPAINVTDCSTFAYTTAAYDFSKASAKP